MPDTPVKYVIWIGSEDENRNLFTHPRGGTYYAIEGFRLILKLDRSMTKTPGLVNAGGGRHNGDGWQL